VAILAGWWHPWSSGSQLQQNASSADTTLLLADTNREGCVAAATSGPASALATNEVAVSRCDAQCAAALQAITTWPTVATAEEASAVEGDVLSNSAAEASGGTPNDGGQFTTAGQTLETDMANIMSGVNSH